MELVKYVRKNGKLVGAVVAVSASQVGWSRCKAPDQFSKTTAVDIARVRAVATSSGSAEDVPRSLQGDVLAMQSRARRYFKTVDEAKERARSNFIYDPIMGLRAFGAFID